ncbi:MAG TPA: amino acid permease [Verrucomicrobiae bacterium]|nr:amino acid permease [Verrucomicrobiae bacterium]
MSKIVNETATSKAALQHESEVQRESGLRRKLSPRQVAMIGLGCTIGTGLFLGSAISVKLAGPAVILSFLAGAFITLTVMWALAEMSVEHPAAGAFGLHAEMYLHPWAGFAVRYTYWICMVIIIGSEVVAAAIYCQYWFPHVPAWVWIAGFSLAMIYINTVSIESFGTFEFWFAMIKVVTVVVFLVLGAALLFGIGFPRIGAANFTAHGGFLPHGWSGMALGVTMAVFSFMGLEIVGTTAGEAADPKVAVPRALRETVLILVLFYVGGLAVVVGIVPWTQIGLGESPFVRVFETVGIPAAGHVMNFVVLTAALSSATCNLYFASRMLFSLSRGGYAPAALGRLSKRDMPVTAVLASSVGMAAALILSHFSQNTVFVFLIGVAFFAAPFVWITILTTHLAFRHATARAGKKILRFAPPGPWSSLVGITALLGVLVSTWWVPSFHITLLAGGPWLVFITLCYLAWGRVRHTAHEEPTTREVPKVVTWAETNVEE